MKTNAMTENVIQVTRLRFVNAYLVGEDEGFTVSTPPPAAPPKT